MLNKLLRLLFAKLFGEGRVSNYDKRQSIKRLHKYGSKVLLLAKEVESETGVNLDLSFGTLLGAYREHDFIPHDDDIDFILNVKDLSLELIECLKEKGFTIDHIYIASDFKGCQIPMKYKGLTCDIYIYYLEPDCNYHSYVPHPIYGLDWAHSASNNIYRSRNIIIPFFDDRVECKFRDGQVLIPANAKEILSHTYGKDFLTPRKGVITKVEETPLTEKHFAAFPIDVVLNDKMIEKVVNSAK